MRPTHKLLPSELRRLAERPRINLEPLKLVAFALLALTVAAGSCGGLVWTLLDFLTRLH